MHYRWKEIIDIVCITTIGKFKRGPTPDEKSHGIKG
jgi:hypothetical protein